MPKRTVKEVSTTVRDYFDSVKKSRFIFDVLDVAFDEKVDTWTVECAVSNMFEEEPIMYSVTLDDDTGEITDVTTEE